MCFFLVFKRYSTFNVRCTKCGDVYIIRLIIASSTTGMVVSPPKAVNIVFLLRIHVRERYVRIIAHCIGDIHRTFGVGSLLNGTHQWVQLVQSYVSFFFFSTWIVNMCLRFGGLNHRPRRLSLSWSLADGLFTSQQ